MRNGGHGMINNRSFVNLIITLALATTVLTLVSCGIEKTEHTAPFGSTITINPDSTTTTGATGACSGIWKDSIFVITVLDPDGDPMNNAVIEITLDWAPNYAHPVVQAMQLYDGASAVTVPYQATTGEFRTKTVTVRHDISCAYKGQLEVFSGSAYAQADIEVN